MIVPVSQKNSASLYEREANLHAGIKPTTLVISVLCSNQQSQSQGDKGDIQVLGGNACE